MYRSGNIYVTKGPLPFLKDENCILVNTNINTFITPKHMFLLKEKIAMSIVLI